MDDDEADFTGLKPGNTLIITLPYMKVSGQLKSYCEEGRCIEVENITNLTGGHTPTRPQFYYAPHILKLELVTDETSKNYWTEKAARLKAAIDEVPDMNLVLPTDQIDKQLETIVVITQYDAAYFRAIDDLRSQLAIAMYVEPNMSARFVKTNIMGIATPQKVYLFDFKALGHIHSEFRKILELNAPQKVVHCCSQICEHLRYQHNVKMNGIFDTFVAYCMVNNTKDNLGLVDALHKVLELPKEYFDAESEDGTGKPYMYNRPMSEQVKLYIGKRVLYLLRMYNQLLHGNMLDNFNRQCKRFSQTFALDKDHVNVAMQITSTSTAGFEHIKPDERDEILMKEF